MTHDERVDQILNSDPDVIGAEPIGIRDIDGAILYRFVNEYDEVVFVMYVKI